jgi:hypothetical protein
MCENKYGQLLVEHGKYDYTWFAKHVISYKKFHCCLKYKTWFSFCLCVGGWNCKDCYPVGQ